MQTRPRYVSGLFRFARCGLWLLILSITGCAHIAAPLEQQAYVWQRVWTPAVIDAVKNAPADFSTLRVLAAEMRADGQFQSVNPVLSALVSTGLPVIAVVRIDGQLAPASSAAVLPLLKTMQQQFREAGMHLRGIEIDHDCASARLPQYTQLLGELRQALPADVRLSITALPTWLQSSALEPLLAQVDEAVLQVHAVENPARGLFSRAQATRWIAAFAARTAKPFRVALPAYGSRVDWDERGRIVAVTSEAPAARAGIEQHELAADPREVAALLKQLQDNPPAHLVGIVWFRLPTADDQRAWRLTTLHAVIAATPLQSDMQARLAPRESIGLYDLVLENRGNLDADLPAAITLDPADCSADALGNYLLQDAAAEKVEAGLRWKLQTPARLLAGQQRIIGWLRCAQDLSGSAIHVEQ